VEESARCYTHVRPRRRQARIVYITPRTLLLLRSDSILKDPSIITTDHPPPQPNKKSQPTTRPEKPTMHLPTLLLAATSTALLLSPALSLPQSAPEPRTDIDLSKRGGVGWLCGRDGTDQATCDAQPPDLRAQYPYCRCAIPVIGTVVGGGFTIYACC